MSNHSKEAGRYSLASTLGRRRALAVGGTALGGLALTVGFSLPAGAVGNSYPQYPNFRGTGLVPPANNTLIGSGSSTTYSMMQQLDVLFNSAPGCQQFVPFPSATSPQPLDYSCVAPPTPAANAENPYNDISVQEAALGSSNGIQQLEYQGAHGAGANSHGTPIPVADNQNYARSSRALSSTDLQGLNFVAYAQDGVSAFHYTKVAGAATPSAGVTNLSQAQLQAIYNGTDTNWNQVGGTNAPIVVFSAQEGSGTQGTWKTFLGFDPSAATNQVNCYTAAGVKTCVGPGVIFENEDAQISPKAFVASQAAFVGKSNPDWGGGRATTAQIQSDAIFFFSAGKYNLSCTKRAGADCGGSKLPTGDANALTAINGVTPNEQTILDGQFPVDRYLYNVYSNGSNSNIPAATAATVNYVSEVGMICNPDKGSASHVFDPLTGTAYINELQSIVLSQGFYPLSAGAASGTVNQTPIDEGTVPHTATDLLTSGDGGKGTSLYGYAEYKAFDTASTTGPNNDPVGFCLTTDTDSNSGS